ncbi:hypothetical protein C8F01DRAFT_1257223 [Mycena amicta]|nr:hypothetical protein C8F01DRAFT_1257223 [Mycena amicta]
MAFAPLRRPESQAKVDPNPSRPQSDGFNYPTFRLLNKQSRVTLSLETLAPANARRVLATARGNGGWFAASTSNGLIVSPLSKLREAFKIGGSEVFKPDCTLPCNPIAIAFACNDTRLLAGTADGQILVYETGPIFSFAASVSPAQVYSASSSPPLQILPNPSNENELAQLVAIVRADGTVEMLDMQMQTRGAWRATDQESVPIAASWSPKGKQLAIGLRSGDILTFGLTNNAAPLKHIPPTASAPLVSLDWLGPAFTFRTSYASHDPPHHIVSFNTQLNTASFVQLMHPFPLPDRSPHSHVLILPHWDQDSSGPDKTLVVIGDASSTDLEVVASAGSTWFQQSQENPLSVPLDKNDEDTFLLTLDIDLTDEMPIMYAYLNDGTIQAWYITHPDSKPYAGLVGGAQASPFGQTSPTPSVFAQQPTSAQPAPTFGQSSFGQSSAFGPQTTSAFGQSGFGQNPAPAFGQSAFGSQPSTSSPFGSSNTSAFGNSPFSSSTTSAFGSGNGGGFNDFASSNNAFGASTPTAPPMSSTPSVSMGEDSGSSFGGLSLGGSNSESDNKPKPAAGGMFGAFNSSPSPLPLPPNHPANQPTTPTPSNFSDPSLTKPSAGFGAFGAVSSGAFGNPKPPSTSAFGGGGAFGSGTVAAKETSSAPSPASSTFGKSTFGQPAFGQSGFATKPAFGQSGFGTPTNSQTTTSTSSGGFGAFAASGPTAFSSTGSSTSSGGFSSFSTQAPGTSAFGGTGLGFGNSSFGKASVSAPSSTPAAAFAGFGTPSPEPSASTASGFGAFGAPSVFGKTAVPADAARETRSPSPNDTDTLKFTTSSPPTASGAFGNLKSASTGFKPAAGFGAFANNAPSSSPFFKTNSPSSPPVSAFGPGASSAPSTPSTPVSGKAAFGATSALGTPKSAFAPISTPPATSSSVSSAFSAFSKASLTPAATPAKSFADLLKIGDEKPTPTDSQASSSISSAPAVRRGPVFTPPPKAPESAATAASTAGPGESPPTDTEKDGAASGESSFGSLSYSSQASSFVEVSGEELTHAEEGEDEDDAPADEEDFLSESFGSGSEGEEDDSRSPSPSTVPLPPSRSPSSTPRAEASKLQPPASPTQSDGDESDSSEASRLSTIREESETPPGSPEKKPPPQSKSTPLLAPVPVVPSPFGIGLGRPSTRPTKSSPLASAPLSGDDGDKGPKPRPASPKLPFGTLPSQSNSEELTPKPSRPKTPPFSALSFSSSTGEPGIPSLGNMPLPPFPNLGKASPSTPSPPSGAFTSGGGFFAGKPNAPGPSAFVPISTPSAAPKGFFSSPPPLMPPKLQPQTPVSLQQPELTMEEGMQKECALLFASITRELEDFRALAQAATQKRLELSKSAGGSRRPSDLGDRSKWSLGDAVQFGQILRSYEQELEDLNETRAQFTKQIREFESNLLKGQEEIGRFLKAQHDKDFAKMLKARTLGPEHLETQSHLRRSVRTIQDRIQKLESHLQESKKRLSRANGGNAGLRAPTLDTLNRTFRNMDIALDNQATDVEKLAGRVAKLSMASSQPNRHSGRDARLPDPVARQRPPNVTPHVAVTAAAALNAERSAHRLKRALLAVRKEPLLNTQAASAPPAPLAFKTPQRTGAPVPTFSLGSLPSPVTPNMVGFDFPEDDFNPSSPPPSTRRGGGGGSRSRVSTSVPLKRSPGQAPVTPSPPAFDWGPIPTFGKPKPVSPENSLSGSWVSDGFKGFSSAK